VLQVLVVAGQHVAAGDALIELDRTSIDAEAASAEAALLTAEAAAARANRLVAAGVIPRREAEQATAQAARARADAATARRTATLATLRAPLSGVVTRVSANVGELADPSRTLIEITNTGTIDVQLTLAAHDAARLRAGMIVSLRSDRDSVGSGAVVEVGGTVDSLTRCVGVRVRVASTTRTLRLGETINGSITVATSPNAITVPLAALVPTGESFRVFVVDSSGIVHAREVTVGGTDETRAHITAGLTAGERVVTTGAYGMDEGARLAPARTPR
jgi:RND family efflux transporter MFP subunit